MANKEKKLENISNVTLFTFAEENSGAYVYFATRDGEYGRVILSTAGESDDPIVQSMSPRMYTRDVQEKMADERYKVYFANLA